MRLHVTSAAPWTRRRPSAPHPHLARVVAGFATDKQWKTTRLGTPGLDAASSNSGDAVYRVTVPHDASYTRPYFTRPTPEQPYYDISDPSLLNRPFAPYPLAGWAEFDYNGVPLRLGPGRADSASRARLWRPLSATRGRAADFRQSRLFRRHRSARLEGLPANRLRQKQPAGNRGRHAASRSARRLDSGAAGVSIPSSCQ